MDWKKNSWIFSLVALVAVAFAVASFDVILAPLIGGGARYNFTNNPNGVVVEEFSDFACPFCNQVRGEVYRVMNKYQGQVNFMFRHLIIHPETQGAAEASECARDQGQFMEFADKVFDNQDFSLPALEAYAEVLGLNMTMFNECVQSDEKATVIQRDYEDAIIRNVMGTPMFFVDGQEVPLEALDMAIEEAINVRAQS